MGNKDYRPENMFIVYTNYSFVFGSNLSDFRVYRFSRLRQVLHIFGLNFVNNILNRISTYLAANPMFHSRMKVIALDYHFIRHQGTKESPMYLMFLRLINLLMRLQSHSHIQDFKNYKLRLASQMAVHLEGVYKI